MAKILGIEFAPLFIPLERRLQTASVAKFIATFLVGGILSTILIVSLCFTNYYFLSLLYLIWYVIDRQTPRRGGRRWEWTRQWTLWEYACNFFPIKLVKTVNIPTNRNYIFAYHPHGIFGISAFMNFATEGTGFSKTFPGLIPRLLILNGHFDFPLYRDYLMCAGVCSVSKDSVRYLLTQEGTGNAVCILIGGALEALESHPGDHTVMISKRKGFIKLALENGKPFYISTALAEMNLSLGRASVVPVYSFGETELYDQAPNPDGSFLKRLQVNLTRYMGISLPVLNGRGIFNYSFGLLPRRRPIHTVVGKPLDFKVIPKPTAEDIEKHHELYKQHLRQLFDDHKQTYGLSADRRLKFI